MPTIEASKKDLEKLIGKKFTDNQLEDALMYVKGEVDGKDGDAIKIDVKETNRPDLWSSEGIAREIKARIGKDKGIKKYKTTKGKVKVYVDKNLAKVRPLIACAVVKNVKIDDDFIIQMVQLQEKVGETFGRKRKETGIGLYDFDIMHPPIHYKGFKDNQIEFVPLEWKVPMRPSEILKQHEKGKAYAHLLEGNTYYPIVIDSKKVVASMPPIINSQVTGKVTAQTKNLFIEVTGFNWNIVSTALEVMCMALADRGGKIETTEINFPIGKTYPSKKVNTPEFKTQKLTFKTELFNQVTGLGIKPTELKTLLEKARYKVSMTKEKTSVEYSNYRQDIMHGVDVVEDALISYGYDKIEPVPVEMCVFGKSLAELDALEEVRDGCIGMGLQEITSFNLTSKTNQEAKMLLKGEKFVELANPMSSNYEIMRKRLLPQALNFLSKNKNQIFPQRIFEVGACLELNPKADIGVNQTNHICGVVTHSNANFTEIKSILVTLCDMLGLKLKIEKKTFSFLGENSAKITVGGKKGFIGELSEEVEKNFGLKKPVALFEFEL
ncbi:MAG: phenylalanine--tRNA ligase subunit beta [Candidatus Diapherotrites archaeon]|jgi:phenylalanyl-tRNA synthetase beta chain|uniref:phenylalanine--tRNA ligase n=1 Tax=Candidatus Iainarchaeum sp. TaxID=3101447 RepID=A0A8T5GFK1_9ARCH|nr:phenylalanine--tRNA ligase subunit beta [Candidatus Diapherotrites archaeon]MBT7241749.1 phenylalanine--tRNA ligase subunit beta [Candidatus Diapherotrites archaeon]